MCFAYYSAKRNPLVLLIKSENQSRKLRKMRRGAEWLLHGSAAIAVSCALFMLMGVNASPALVLPHALKEHCKAPRASSDEHGTKPSEDEAFIFQYANTENAPRL